MMQAGCRRRLWPVLAGVVAGVMAMAAAPVAGAATAPPGTSSSAVRRSSRA